MASHHSSLILLVFISSAQTSSFFSFIAGQPGPSPRFVHFTEKLSLQNIDFQPMFGSLKCTKAGLYHLSYHLESSPSSALITALYLYPTMSRGRSANRAEKQILGGCSAPTRSSCSSNTVVRLFAGDVVRLEIEDGFLVRNIFNSFSGHQVPEYHSNIMQRSVSDCEYRADTCQSICSAICQSAISAHRTTTTTAQGHTYPTTTPRQFYYPTTDTSPSSQPRYPDAGPPSPPPVVDDKPSCCPSIIIKLSGSCHAYQHSKAGLYTLTKSVNTTTPVYKQSAGLNYAYFHPSASAWQGWLVGPNTLTPRGGLACQSTSSCPTSARGWQFYSPGDGFVDGDISVECLGSTAYHYHHHKHYHKALEHKVALQAPGYTITADQNIVDARFVFPNNKANQSSPVPTLHPSIFIFLRWVIFMLFILCGFILMFSTLFISYLLPQPNQQPKTT